MGIWEKKDKYFCRNCTNNKGYDTMMEAILDLKNVGNEINGKKMVIYDMFCDGVGYFCTCPREEMIKQTHPRGIDCVYVEKGIQKRKRVSKIEL